MPKPQKNREALFALQEAQRKVCLEEQEITRFFRPIEQHIPWSIPGSTTQGGSEWSFGVVKVRIGDYVIELDREGKPITSISTPRMHYETGSVSFGDGPARLTHRLVGNHAKMERALVREAPRNPERLTMLIEDLKKLLEVRELITAAYAEGRKVEGLGLVAEQYSNLCARMAENTGAYEIWQLPLDELPGASINFLADPEIQSSLLTQARKAS